MLFNKLALSVIEEFLGDYKSSVTGSDIARKKSLNQKSVSNTLNMLEKEGVLKIKASGKNKMFRLNFGDPERLKNILTAAEHLRTAGFLDSHPMAKEIVTKTRKAFNGIVIIFGSYSKGAQKKDSDLDIFVAGTCDNDAVDKISEIYGLRISVKNYPANAINRALKKNDILLTEIIKNHIIVSGAEEFVNTLMENRDEKN